MALMEAGLLGPIRLVPAAVIDVTF
jgi:hypothetical protein